LTGCLSRCLSVCWFSLAALSLQASRYLSGGVGSCSAVYVRSPHQSHKGGVHVGKANGYNRLCAANAIPSENTSVQARSRYLRCRMQCRRKRRQMPRNTPTATPTTTAVHMLGVGTTNTHRVARL